MRVFMCRGSRALYFLVSSFCSLYCWGHVCRLGLVMGQAIIAFFTVVVTSCASNTNIIYFAHYSKSHIKFSMSCRVGW